MTLSITWKPTGPIHLLVSPRWESPPITKGSRAQRFWKYQQRMTRFDRLKQRYEAEKGRPMLMIESLWIGDLFMDTFKHIEALGYEFEEDDFGKPTWRLKA